MKISLTLLVLLLFIFLLIDANLNDFDKNLKKSHRKTLLSPSAQRSWQSSGELPQSEYNALYNFYSSFNGNSWKWYTNISTHSIPWNFTDSNLSNPCSDNWQGVNCTCSSGVCHLTDLILSQHNLTGSFPTNIFVWKELAVFDLSYNNIKGVIPPQISNLAALQTLNIANNELTSTIPTEIGDLASLIVLDLSNNKLNGTLPSSIFHLSEMERLILFENALFGPLSSRIETLSVLRELNIHDNRFNGEIPSQLFELQNLEEIHIATNYFTGTIPPNIGDCKSLQVFDIQTNFISSEIPPSIGNLSQLTELHLNFNFMYGTIPKILGNLKQLISFNIQSNFINGTLPESLFNLTNLQQFAVSGNFIYGEISPSLRQLTNLRQLGLGLNYFSGEFPDIFSDMHNLNLVSLFYNDFHSTIPSSLIELTNLTTFSIVKNRFYSTIPDQLGKLKKLRIFDIGINELTGMIPSSIGNLSNLILFNAINNQLHGSFPSNWANENTTSVSYLGLGNNLFTGTIPINIEKYWKNLTFFGIERNRFYGTLPLNFSNFPNIQSIGINNNQFYGRISSQSLENTSLVLQFECQINSFTGLIPFFPWPRLELYTIFQNYFTGSIYHEFDNYKDLVHFELNYNYLTGKIPNWLGEHELLKYANFSYNLFTGSFNYTLQTFSPFIQLQQLSVHHNFLTGTIPTELGYVNNLIDLNLNDNQFTGTIPSTFFFLYELESLHLQNNILTGTIGEWFARVNRLSNVDFSNNHLTGSLPSVFSFSPLLRTFDASENCLHGTIPPDICNATLLSVLVLDGLSTATNCRFPIFPYSRNLHAFTITTFIQKGIPDCLFSMPALETLHISGNGITGSFPLDVNISTSLTYLALSHNQLTGSIPLYIQERNWTNLDLSYNKLGGTLSNSFQSFNDISTLSLEINRLSGGIPGLLQTSTNIDILEGNIFQCSANRHDLPKHDSKASSYSCGSDVVNATLYTWLALFSVTMLILFLMYYYHFYRKTPRDPNQEEEGNITNVSSIANNHRNTESSLSTTITNTTTTPNTTTTGSFLKYLKRVYLWRNYYLYVEHNTENQDIIKLLYLKVLFFNVRSFSLIFSFFIILLILLPLYIILSVYYNSYFYSYAWNVSGVFLSSENAGICLTIFWLLLSFMIIGFYELFVVNGFKVLRESFKKRWSEILFLPRPQIERELPMNKDYSYLVDNTALAIITFCNLVMMMSVDIIYVFVFLNYSTVVIIFAEALLAVIKLTLNNQLLWMAIPFVKKHLKKAWKGKKKSQQEGGEGGGNHEFSQQSVDLLTQSRYYYTTKDTIFMTVTVLLNNIIFPVFSILLVSSDCFYYALFDAPDVDSSYSYLVCDEYTPASLNICLAYRRQIESSSFTPPFIYSYNCASTIVVNYAPVFILMYTFEGFLSIGAKVSLKYLVELLKEKVNQKKKQKSTDIEAVDHSSVKPLDYEWWLALVTRILPSYWQDMTPLPPFTGDYQSFFFDKNRMSVRLSAHIVVLLSLGVLFPPLALIVFMTICSITMFEEMIIGRLLSESKRLGYIWYRRQLERDCHGIGAVLKHTLWTIVPISSLLFAYVVFDTWGDKKGASSALLPTLLLAICPISAFICLQIFKRRSEKSPLQKKNQDIEIREISSFARISTPTWNASTSPSLLDKELQEENKNDDDVRVEVQNPLTF